MRQLIGIALIAAVLALGSTGIVQQDVGQWNILYSEGSGDPSRDLWANAGFSFGCSIGAFGLGFIGIFVGAGCALGFAY